MVKLDEIRAHREAREQHAAETASMIAPGDYYAASNNVVRRDGGEVVATCASHWDACLVLLAMGKHDDR